MGAVIEAGAEVDSLVGRVDDRLVLRFDQIEIGETEAVGTGSEEWVQFLVDLGPRTAILRVGQEPLLIDRQGTPGDIRSLEVHRSRIQPGGDVEDIHRHAANLLEDRNELVEVETGKFVSFGINIVGCEPIKFVIACRELLHAVNCHRPGSQRLERRHDLPEVGIDLSLSRPHGGGEPLVEEILTIAPGTGDGDDYRTDEGDHADKKDPDREAVATDVWRAHHPDCSLFATSAASGCSVAVPSVTRGRLVAPGSRAGSPGQPPAGSLSMPSSATARAWRARARCDISFFSSSAISA